MTPTEMKYELGLQLKTILSILPEPFITLDFSKLLSDSQNEFVLMAYNTFDRTELEKKILTSLISRYTTTVFTDNTSNYANGVTVALPTNLLFALEEHVILSGIVAPATVVPIKYDYYNTNINNPFVNPYDELVWRLDFNGQHELITNGSIITSYSIRYIARPNDINVDSDIECQVNSFFHRTIVDGAAKKALTIIAKRAALEQPRQQQPQQARAE